MTLLREVIHIPERTYGGEFVLKLTEGIGDVDRTMADYVVTDRLARNFDEALGLIETAITAGQSKAAYLHGSFGAGKSHFMAVLHALLRKEPAARSRAELADVVAKHDSWLADRRLLLVPYHLIGANSLESAVLGGYVKQVRALHPDAPIPAVHQTDGLITNARRLRIEVGDQKFIDGLPAPVSGWGTLPGKPWTPEELDAAMAAPHGDDLRSRLINDLLQSWAQGWLEFAEHESAGYVSLDTGLSAISEHAKGLGYDGVVLFLDELVLWLASRIADKAFVTAEASKVSKFVEAGDARRPVPIVSFIARQRDLAELVGESTAGAELQSLYDVLKYWEGRFGLVVLENANLPEIARQRLLKPINAEAAAQIEAAFEQMRRLRPEVWDTLLGAEGSTGSDIEAFRATYPFSPAFMDTLVVVSGALQRERTALTLMQKILVDRRDDLTLGELIPLGDLYEAIASGNDQPFTEKLKVEYENAKKLYTHKLRPYLLGKHGVTEDRLFAPTPSDAGAVRALRGDDRLVKTLLLSALAPQVPALRNLTARRLAALNHGSISSPIPGGEVAAVATKVREWAGRFGEVKYIDADDPGVALELVGVDVDSVLVNVRHVDTQGARRTKVKELLWDELGAALTDEFLTTHTVVWRGTRRPIELVFGNIRDKSDIRDEQFSPADPIAWRLIIDYPFDEGSHAPTDDRGRVQELVPRGEEHVVCWIPAFFTQDRQRDLGQLVKADYLLTGNRFEENAQHLSPADRHRARSVIASQRDVLAQQLRDVLKQSYGLARPQPADVVAGYDQHLLSLDSGHQPMLPSGARFKDALVEIVGQMCSATYPAHPNFDPDHSGTAVRRPDLQVVLDTVTRATQTEDGRVEVEKSQRPIVRRIANPLQLGEMHEAAFVLSRHWQQEFERLAAQESIARDLPVADLTRWLAPIGLDVDTANLVVAAYAATADRAWVRADVVLDAPPKIAEITKDMVLRAQEIPDDATWNAATERAKAIFDMSTPPLRSGRTTAELARALRTKARAHAEDARRLVDKLDGRASTLGLDPAALTGRLGTARLAERLVDALESGPDKSLVEALATVDMPVAPAVVGRSLQSSGDLVAALRLADWNSLDIISGLGERWRARADEILNKLHEAADVDELTHPLGMALVEASRAAQQLVKEAVTQPHPPLPPPDPRRQVSRQAAASEIAPVLDELRAFATEHEGEIIEITWHVVGEA